MSADSLLQSFERQVAACADVKRWLIAYSGGLDSRVLVELAARVLDPGSVLLLHINHHLQPDAGVWAVHCGLQASKLGLAIKVIDVQPASASEADARDARYAAFVREAGKGDVVLMGHHADDQAETLLLRLVRGAGPNGLRGMPRRRPLGVAHLLRPLLDVTRAQLESWAQSQQLDWVEDPSNASIDYDRNFIRHRVMPALAQRWPDVQSRMGISAGLLDETVLLLEAVARSDLAACVGVHQGLKGDVLAALPASRQRNLLRYWVGENAGVTLNSSVLARIEQELLLAAVDRQPQLRLGACSLRRYRGDLFLVPAQQSTPVQAIEAIKLAAGVIELRQGQLSVLALTSGALSTPDSGPVAVAGYASQFALRTLEGVTLRYRRNGERCRPVGRSGSHPLKKLFQEYAVPPWLRDDWPILVCADEIVAVAGLWVCEGWQASPGGVGYFTGWAPGTTLGWQGR